MGLDPQPTRFHLLLLSADLQRCCHASRPSQTWQNYDDQSPRKCMFRRKYSQISPLFLIRKTCFEKSKPGLAHPTCLVNRVSCLKRAMLTLKCAGGNCSQTPSQSCHRDPFPVCSEQCHRYHCRFSSRHRLYLRQRMGKGHKGLGHCRTMHKE